MKVFLPFYKDPNRYLDEIENFFQGEFIYGDYHEYKKDYAIVNIHWPEAIFHGHKPSIDQIEELKKHLAYWKKHSIIIYTRHNEIPHYKQTYVYKALYKLVLNSVDGIIHLGGKSYYDFIKSNLKIKQIVIHHPLYLTFPNNSNKKNARNKMGIAQNKKIILVMGNIRSIEEQKLIIQSFKKIKTPNKLLIVPRFPFFSNDTFPLFAKRTYRLIQRLYYKTHNNYLLASKFIKPNNIQDYLLASDVIFIPRIKALNSGNAFLGFTFDTIVVGPNIGNISEILKRLNYPVFNPNEIKSIALALEKGIELSETNLAINNHDILYKKYHPKNIANEYYNFYKSFLNTLNNV